MSNYDNLLNRVCDKCGGECHVPGCKLYNTLTKLLQEYNDLKKLTSVYHMLILNTHKEATHDEITK